eukprot:746841-Hanusia_phi.AAC.2
MGVVCWITTAGTVPGFGRAGVTVQSGRDGKIINSGLHTSLQLTDQCRLCRLLVTDTPPPQRTWPKILAESEHRLLDGMATTLKSRSTDTDSTSVAEKDQSMMAGIGTGAEARRSDEDGRIVRQRIDQDHRAGMRMERARADHLPAPILIGIYKIVPELIVRDRAVCRHFRDCLADVDDISITLRRRDMKHASNSISIKWLSAFTGRVSLNAACVGHQGAYLMKQDRNPTVTRYLQNEPIFYRDYPGIYQDLRFLKENGCNLVSLDLSGSITSAAATLELAAVLPIHTLKSLKISTSDLCSKKNAEDTHFSPELSTLCKNLAQQTGLVDLDLSGNYIPFRNCVCLAHVVKANTNLETLDLGYNYFIKRDCSRSRSAFQELLRAIKHLANLRELTLATSIIENHANVKVKSSTLPLMRLNCWRRRCWQEL